MSNEGDQGGSRRINLLWQLAQGNESFVVPELTPENWPPFFEKLQLIYAGLNSQSKMLECVRVAGGWEAFESNCLAAILTMLNDLFQLQDQFHLTYRVCGAQDGESTLNKPGELIFSGKAGDHWGEAVAHLLDYPRARDFFRESLDFNLELRNSNQQAVVKAIPQKDLPDGEAKDMRFLERQPTQPLNGLEDLGALIQAMVEYQPEMQEVVEETRIIEGQIQVVLGRGTDRVIMPGLGGHLRLVHSATDNTD